MKKLRLNMGSMIEELASRVSVVSVNSACHFYNYQSKVPEEMKKLRRF